MRGYMLLANYCLVLLLTYKTSKTNRFSVRVCLATLGLKDWMNTRTKLTLTSHVIFFFTKWPKKSYNFENCQQRRPWRHRHWLSGMPGRNTKEGLFGRIKLVYKHAGLLRVLYHSRSAYCLYAPQSTTGARSLEGCVDVVRKLQYKSGNYNGMCAL